MPTFVHGKNAKFYLVDSGATERDLSSVGTQVQFPRSAETAETTAFGKSSKTYIPGLKDSTIGLEGPRDATTEGYIAGVLGVASTFAYCPEGSASGKVKYSGALICTSLSETSSTGDANRYSAEFQISDDVTTATL